MGGNLSWSSLECKVNSKMRVLGWHTRVFSVDDVSWARGLRARPGAWGWRGAGGQRTTVQRRVWASVCRQGTTVTLKMAFRRGCRMKLLLVLPLGVCWHPASPVLPSLPWDLPGAERRGEWCPFRAPPVQGAHPGSLAVLRETLASVPLCRQGGRHPRRLCDLSRPPRAQESQHPNTASLVHSRHCPLTQAGWGCHAQEPAALAPAPAWDKTCPLPGGETVPAPFPAGDLFPVLSSSSHCNQLPPGGRKHRCRPRVHLHPPRAASYVCA